MKSKTGRGILNTVFFGCIAIGLIHCKAKEGPLHETNNRKDVSRHGPSGVSGVSGITIKSILSNVFIGEAFSSGAIYIEPFTNDWYDFKGDHTIANAPAQISYFIIGENGENGEKIGYSRQARYSEFIHVYVPGIETQSDYFSAPFSETPQAVLKYRAETKTETGPEQPALVIAFFNHEGVSVDCSIRGLQRKANETETDLSNETIETDQKNENRTLDYIQSENTILGAKYLCLVRLDPEFTLKLSVYLKHGREYAGNAYVLDIFQNEKLVQSIEKWNYDGPY